MPSQSRPKPDPAAPEQPDDSQAEARAAHAAAVIATRQRAEAMRRRLAGRQHTDSVELVDEDRQR